MASEGSKEAGGVRSEAGELELDAARALADFAQRALMESRGEMTQIGDSSGGKREEEEEGSSMRKRWRKTVVNCESPSVSGSTDEKEAKRIRRILANRESARQTIRRRQAIHDELSKTVADLSLYNEKMKMEKELAMKEYLSLKGQNKQLKEQIAKTIRSEVEVGAGIAPQEMDVSASLSTDIPLVIQNSPPFAPYIWPALPSISPNSRPCNEEGICGLKKLFYMPPYSWFYPLIHQLSGYCPPCPHVSSDRDENSLRKQDLSLYSEALDDIDKTSSCRGSKTDVALSRAVATEKEKNIIIASGKPSSPHAESRMLGSHPDGVLLVPPLKTLNPSSVGEVKSITEARDESLKPHVDSILRANQQVQSILPRDKLVDASAAAEARKRRKELTKLKRQLQGRHVRLPC